MREIGLRGAARDILKNGLKAVDAGRLIKKAVRRDGSIITLKGNNAEAWIDLEQFKRVYVVAFGKAAPPMASAFLQTLKKRVNMGIVVCLPGVPFSWSGVARVEAPHPLPDERCVQAAERIIELGRKVQPQDIVFFLISGGASSQVTLPLQPLSLGEKINVIRSLMNAGADIRELNVVRKHLSGVKGGKLGDAFKIAVVVNLIISDVIDDDVETIASGLTTWDSSTFEEAREILRKYELWKKCSPVVRKLIEKGVKGEIEETRKKETVEEGKIQNFIIGNNEVAVRAASERAREVGYRPIIISRQEKGEARRGAKLWASLVHSISSRPEGLVEPLALISGGELTVTVKGKGKGGRNTEFCLALLHELEKKPLPKEIDWVAASLATDGRDGPTEAAGALVSASTLKKAYRKSLALTRYLQDNDSFSFFQRVQGLIVTGITRTNVMDLRLFLLRKLYPNHQASKPINIEGDNS